MDSKTVTESIIKRIAKAFPEAGVLTVGRMVAAYDRNWEEAEYYTSASINYFNKLGKMGSKNDNLLH